MLVSAGAGFYLQHHAGGNVTEGVEQEVSPPQNPTPESVIGQRRPDFSLPDLHGQQRQVSEFDGKLLIINFWATWCPPCTKEIPEFIHLQNEFAERGLQFLGIALQTADEVQPFYEEYGMNYPSLVGQAEVIALAERFGNDLGALPYTIFIDQNGIMRHVKRGPVSSAEALSVIEELL